MPYYNPNASGLTPAASLNLVPVNVPPVNRYTMPVGLEVNSSVTTLVNYVHARVAHIEYIPFLVDTTTTYDRIGLSYVNANSCVSTWYYDIALYEGNVSERYPATKLTDFGTITIDPASTPTGAQLITINQQLEAGKLYFLAIGVRWSDNTDFLANRSPFLTLIQGNYPMFYKRGMSSATPSGFGLCWVDSLGSYSGTLPSTTSYAGNASFASVSPRLALRRSA
jgi:hypothetical protein